MVYLMKFLIQGQPVYVNYAKEADFQYLRDNHPSINLTGKICIARYGGIYRGDKVYPQYTYV